MTAGRTIEQLRSILYRESIRRQHIQARCVFLHTTESCQCATMLIRELKYFEYVRDAFVASYRASRAVGVPVRINIEYSQGEVVNITY